MSTSPTLATFTRSLPRLASAAAIACAASILLGCEPSQSVDASQVRPAGSAPSEVPGHTVKFSPNEGATAPAAPSGGEGAK